MNSAINTWTTNRTLRNWEHFFKRIWYKTNKIALCFNICSNFFCKCGYMQKTVRLKLSSRHKQFWYFYTVISLVFLETLLLCILHYVHYVFYKVKKFLEHEITYFLCYLEQRWKIFQNFIYNNNFRACIFVY